MQAVARRKSHLIGCGWFWAWALAGAGFGLGLTALGVFTVLPAAFAVVLMTRHRPIRGAFGLVTGVGSILLVIAYIQRSGQSYDPVHWLIPGLVLFTAGVVAHAWTAPNSG
jgi:predicted membrane channel-forming protein YqfA (hemolysin III family)